MRTYQLIRYAPDPARGETINIAIVAFDESGPRVLTLAARELARRAECIAPHVSSANAQVFLRELASAAREASAVQGLLKTFNPHVRFEEPRRISSAVDLEATINAAFKSLVAQPPKRRKKAPRWSVDRAIETLFDDAPNFGSRVRRNVSPFDEPATFGLSTGLFEDAGDHLEELDDFEFDAVLPNCVRVVALKGFVLSKGASLTNFYEMRSELTAAKKLFEAASTSKQVITGALLLPHRDKPVPLHTRDEMREDLRKAVRDVTIAGAPRMAVFDAINPADLKALDTLAAEMEAADDERA